MTAATITLKRRDPAVIAGRAHAVLDAVARTHAQWPDEGREAIGMAFIRLHVALEKYRAAGDDDQAGEALTASCAMALLLLSVSVFLGKGVADQMMKNAAEVAR